MTRFRRFFPVAFAATLALLFPPPAKAASGSVIISAVTATATSAEFDLSKMVWARAKIFSAAGSVSTVILEHKTSAAADAWATGFTCTDVSAASLSSDGTLCYVDLALTSRFRANVSAYTSGTITVTLETQQ